MKVPSFNCLIWNPRKKLNSPIIDISNYIDIILPNSWFKASKNDIININLTNEEVPIDVLGEECSVHPPNLEPLHDEEVSETLIPSSRSLLKIVERLLQPINMIRKPRILKLGWLVNIHNFINETI